MQTRASGGFRGLPSWVRSTIPVVLASAAGFLGPKSAFPQDLVVSTVVTEFISLSSLNGIAVDSSGAVYYSDALNHVVRRISPSGIPSAYAGTYGIPGSSDGPVASALFAAPFGLVFDASGNLYVADRNNDTVRMITPSGSVTTFAGIAGRAGNADGPRSRATFNKPTSLAFGPSGDLYVTDYGNLVIRRISPAGVVSTYAHTFYGGAPLGIAADSQGNLYVSENTVMLQSPGNPPFGPQAIDRISPSGKASLLAGQPAGVGYLDGPGASARFYDPKQVALDPSGNLYVADAGNGVIREITPAGVVSTVAGTANDPRVVWGPIDGRGAFAKFMEPRAIAFASSGIAYLSAAGAICRCIPASFTDGPVRFCNLSSRGTVDASNSLVSGFVVEGSVSQTVLLRAVGPTLAQSFGVANVLSQPQLNLFDSTGRRLASSADGLNRDDTQHAAQLAGAFPLAIPTVSGDVAFVITLAPGAYTAAVTAPNGGSGTVLLEAYEIP